MIKVNKVSLKIIGAARKLKIFDDTFILILAALVGLAGGYFAIAFRYLIIYVTAALRILCGYISIGIHYLVLHISKIFSLQQYHTAAKEYHSISKASTWRLRALLLVLA